ncbi:MAG: 5'/3'-nucleotidase SurE [Bacteroidetes bacterium]|nr:MAG: 5'/3'-nucleotidase SurE [Bacteroidota bacterium]TNE98827.1 MAG: 5'/3'-nucleotidase SurE [Bacteroidota bacterium]
MQENKPLILVTNDDGVSSKGIRSLVEVASRFGEVVVVAPDSPQSGMGHAITIHDPIRLHTSDIFDPIQAYATSGTPVDCVKLAVYEILHRKPDLLLSGINHGSNAATNVLYSGTMSAAVEGAMEGIPSIGFSLESFDQDADFETSKKVVSDVIQLVLENGLSKNTCLNVNIPYVSEADFKGIKVCRAAHAFWEDRFESRKDQFGRPYFWLTGDFVDQEKSEDTDLYWLERGFASIVPTQFDMTDYKALETLKNWM